MTLAVVVTIEFERCKLCLFMVERDIEYRLVAELGIIQWGKYVRIVQDNICKLTIRV